MRHLRHALLPVLLLVAAACGGGGNKTTDPTTDGGATTSSTAGGGTGATTEILGEPTTFQDGGHGASSFSATVRERECELTEALFGTCRASTGAGGAFLVTVEGVADSVGDWNIVVRCGLDPAEPVASANGTFQPVTAELGLAPYGEVLSVTMTQTDEAEAALVYQPEGADCPVVWSLGAIMPSTLFLGGTDRLNGDEQPIRFTKVDGSTACAVADGAGGIEVTAAAGGSCSS